MPAGRLLDVAIIGAGIAGVIRGTARLDMATLGYKINHFDIVRDPGSYPEGRGWALYRDIALHTPDDRPYPLL